MDFTLPAPIEKSRRKFREFVSAEVMPVERDPVAWGDGETFHSYWKATGTTTDYQRGQGANAFTLGSAPTSTAILKLAPLLFPGAPKK